MHQSRSLYYPDIERILNQREKDKDLHSKLQIARIYLNQKVLPAVLEYMELCKFTYRLDLLDRWEDTYVEGYFQNLVHEERRPQRRLLEDKIIEELPKLLR